jgi:hypothetical protein
MIGNGEEARGVERGFAAAILQEALDTKLGYAEGPERNLLSALLFDGIQSYVNFLLAKTETEKSRYREAYRWVQSQESDYTFSFEAVCEGLGINPEYLRLGIISATNPHLRSIAKSRRVW